VWLVDQVVDGATSKRRQNGLAQNAGEEYCIRRRAKSWSSDPLRNAPLATKAAKQNARHYKSERQGPLQPKQEAEYTWCVSIPKASQSHRDGAAMDSMVL